MTERHEHDVALTFTTEVPLTQDTCQRLWGVLGTFQALASCTYVAELTVLATFIRDAQDHIEAQVVEVIGDVYDVIAISAKRVTP